MTPLWLLDVDGVLNAVSELTTLRKLDPQEHWTDYQLGEARGYNIIWSRTVAERIGTLHTEGHVEVQWLTTWEEHAQTEIAPLLGLPHFELAGKREYEGPGWWKLPLAQRATTLQRPFVWTDDDITAGTGAIEWAKQRLEHGGAPAALVTPKWDLGITPKQLAFIEKFVAEVSCV